MSLVNDALKKARMEAARTEAANRNIPYPVLGRGRQPSNGQWIVVLGAVVLAVVGGFLLYRAGKRSTLDKELVARAATAPTAAAETSDGGSRLGQPKEPVSGQPQSERSRPEPQSPTPEARPRPATATPPAQVRRPGAPTEGTTASGSEPTRARAQRPSARPAGSPTDQSARDSAPAPRESSEPSPRPTKKPSPIPSAVAGDTTVPEPAQPEPGASSGDPAPREFLRRADIPGVGPIELGGIAWSGDRPFALVNGSVVRPGDSVSGLIVDGIEPNTVRMSGDEGALILRLK